jgi:hypothetical protein
MCKGGRGMGGLVSVKAAFGFLFYLFISSSTIRLVFVVIIIRLGWARNHIAHLRSLS